MTILDKSPCIHTLQYAKNKNKYLTLCLWEEQNIFNFLFFWQSYIQERNLGVLQQKNIIKEV